MLHLDPERLAALADGEPSADDAAHLVECADCAREVAAYRALLVHAAHERSTVLGEPLTDWSLLSDRLRGEGLLGRAGGARGPFGLRVWVQAAAAAVIAAVGVAAGRASVRPAGGPAASGAVAATATTPNGAGARLTSASADSARAITSVSDALALMRRAESDYRLAAAYIAANDTSVGGRSGVDLYRTRLAALDRVSQAALAAVNEAPSDPVVNQYLISARSARAVTLQQLNESLPAGVKLASY